MERLYLVGTNHMDPKGPERLGKFLDFVRPDLIGVESTEPNYHSRINEHKILASQELFLRAMLTTLYGKGKAEAMYRYMTVPNYELWVPAEYRDSTKIELAFCDKPLEDVQINQFKKELMGDMVDDSGAVTEKYLDELAKTDLDQLQAAVDGSYQVSELGDLGVNSERMKTLILDRDVFIESSLRGYLGRGYSTLVFVGGSNHMYGDYQPNLYDRLSDLNPIRVTLPEIDKF